MNSNATPSIEKGTENADSASTSTDKRKSDQHSDMIAGIAVVLLIAVGWAVWKVGIATVFLFLVKAVLWAIVVLGALGCVGFVLMAIASKKEDEKTGSSIVAVICAVVAVVAFWLIPERGISYPDLPESASAAEITKVFRPHLYHIEVQYSYGQRVTTREFFGERTSFATRRGSVTGSGILIANDDTAGLIVTNRHVVDPIFSGNVPASVRLSEIQIVGKTPDENHLRKLEVVAVHRERDLALVLVRKNFKRREAVVVVRQADLRQGEPAVALGNPLGIEFVTSEGLISISKAAVAGDMIGTSCPISPGNSGGPLFLVRHGYLAGINTAGFHEEGVQNLNFAEPAEAAVKGLHIDSDGSSSRIKIKISGESPSVQQSWLGLTGRIKARWLRMIPFFLQKFLQENKRKPKSSLPPLWVARPSWDWKISGEERKRVVELAKMVKLVGGETDK